MDGKLRQDGVRSFLASRGITLEEGSLDDAPEAGTVNGLGNAKNAHFLKLLASQGADSFPHAVALVRSLQKAGIATAVISASRNAEAVLASAGVLELFTVRVDGVVAAELGLPGKPDPAVFLEAARRLGVPPERAVVVEDAQAGVEAGRAGGFGLVVGVDRGGEGEGLRAQGAHVVVSDLGQVRLVDTGRPHDLAHMTMSDPRRRPESRGPESRGPESRAAEPRPIRSLPSALACWDEIGERLGRGTPVLFFDYDGTLTPIVERPEDAHLGDAMRAALARLSHLCPVAVVSGRDVAFVMREVGLGDLWYLGSHGFDVVAPSGVDVSTGREHEFAAFLGPLDEAEEGLRRRLVDVVGAQVERKKFAVAVHYRRVADDEVPLVEQTVEAEAERHPELRVSGGKRVFEIRPDIDWDKGRAVLWALRALGVDRAAAVPLYVGDDVTDEDAFAVLAATSVGPRALSIVVGGGERGTRAEFSLPDTDALEEFLGRLAAVLEGAAQ